MSIRWHLPAASRWSVTPVEAEYHVPAGKATTVKFTATCGGDVTALFPTPACRGQLAIEGGESYDKSLRPLASVARA